MFSCSSDHLTFSLCSAACRCFHWRLRVFLCSVSRTAEPDRAGSHQALGGNQSGVLGRVCKVRLESNAKNSSSPTAWFLIPFLSLLRPSPSAVPGAGVRDFFCRVAALTFEANILSDLEKIGSRNISDIISESLCFRSNVIINKPSQYSDMSLGRFPSNSVSQVQQIGNILIIFHIATVCLS